MNLQDLTGQLADTDTETQPPADGDITKIVTEEQKAVTANAEEDKTDNLGAPPPKPTGINATTGADLIAGTIDMTQTYIFRAGHRWKFGRWLVRTYGPDARQKLKEVTEDVDRKRAAKEDITMSYEMWEMYYMKQRHDHIIDEIPFKQHEIDKWKQCLEPFIEQNGGNIPANWAIVLAAITTLGPRTADFFFEKV